MFYMTRSNASSIRASSADVGLATAAQRSLTINLIQATMFLLIAAGSGEH